MATDQTFDPMKLRSAMKWGVKSQPKFENGKIILTQRVKVYVPVKFLEIGHMQNIIRMLKKNPDEIWNGYPASLWVKIFKWEISYQNNRINNFISEVIKLQYNTMAEMFIEYADLAFSVDVIE